MDKSLDRRQNIEKHLSQTKIPFRRVKGLNTFEDIYFPEDVLTNWNKIEARLNTDEVLPSRRDFQSLLLKRSLGNFSHVMAGLIGRSKKNSLKEIGCTASHLEAMRQVHRVHRMAVQLLTILTARPFTSIDHRVDMQLSRRMTSRSPST